MTRLLAVLGAAALASVAAIVTAVWLAARDLGDTELVDRSFRLPVEGDIDWLVEFQRPERPEPPYRATAPIGGMM